MIDKEQEQRAKIKNGWVVCPICRKRQFPISEGAEIRSLRYKCKKGGGCFEHYMMIDFPPRQAGGEDS